MIFEGLNSLRRSAIMTSIVLMAVGVIMLMLPEDFLPAFIDGAGAVVIIMSIVMIFDFLSSNKALIHFVYLTGAIALGIIGIAILIFRDDVLFVLGFFLGLFLALESINGIIHSYVYARRSARKGWWVLIPLYVIQIVLGLILMINPFWKEIGEFKMIIGAVIVFSSIVSAVRVIWIWPIRKD